MAELDTQLNNWTLEDTQSTDGATQHAGGATIQGFDLYSDLESVGGADDTFHLDKYGAPFGVGEDWGHHLTWAGEEAAERVMDNNSIMEKGPGNDAKDE